MDKTTNKKTNNHDLILGLDDAGRGPVIGNMVLAGVLITRKQEKFLKENNVKDSKLLSHHERIRLSKLINENSIGSYITESTPKEIDTSITTGTNLNTLEAKKMAEAINSLNNKKDKIRVVIDCPSVNLIAWRSTLLNFIEHPQNLLVKCEHKADLNYTAVSAASILAKVRREEGIKDLKKKIKVDFGSGYPADPVTIKFLKERGLKYRKHGIIRETWQTWKNLYGENNQKKLF